MKPRIVFVDDEPNVRRGVQRMLWDLEAEWDIAYAECGEEAIRLAETTKTHLIITDHNMPGMTGLELIEALTKRTDLGFIPLIVLTGAGERDLKRRALDAGACDLLHKPIEAEDLIARIRSSLAQKMLHDELETQKEQLEVLVKQRTLELESSRLEIVLKLARVTELFDSETGCHILRVARTSKLTAKVLGYDEEFQENILLASPLHDIGKIGVPQMVLLKPSSLSEEEVAVMQTHCRIGYEILAGKCEAASDALGDLIQSVDSTPFITMAATIALQHHERWDGGGYPNGLKGEQIDPAARITAVADVFDAIRSERPYKKAIPEPEALQIIKSSSGTHFDPEVVDAFIAAQAEFASSKIMLRAA